MISCAATRQWLKQSRGSHAAMPESYWIYLICCEGSVPSRLLSHPGLFRLGYTASVDGQTKSPNFRKQGDRVELAQTLLLVLEEFSWPMLAVEIPDAPLALERGVLAHR